jgi:hypothetical protein
MDDSATVVEEKKNPTARQLLMKILKKDMPGVLLFVDVGSNWQKSEFLATYPKRWKDEARFVTANIPAYLYHHFGDVGLSFFLPYVRNAVKLQGWNEKEDRPITAGEEALDKVLKPYAEDSRMTIMFDFSNMEDSKVRDDIQQQSLHPEKNGKPSDRPPDDMQQATATKPQPAAQVSAEQRKQDHHEALSVGSSKAQSVYYHRDGRPRESSNRQEVHWGDNSTLQTGAPDDDLSIKTDEHIGIQYLNDDREPTFNITESPDDDLDMDRIADEPPTALDDDTVSILTSATQRSNARKRRFEEEFARLKADHQAEMEACQKAQKEVQDQQEAQLAASLRAMEDLKLQMTALQAKQTPSADSGAVDAPQEE